MPRFMSLICLFFLDWLRRLGRGSEQHNETEIKASTSSTMKRSASINFEFVRHSGARRFSIGNVVFSLVRFVAFFRASWLKRLKNYLQAETAKNSIRNWLEPFVTRHHRRSENLIDGRGTSTIDYQFVSQKLFGDKFNRRCVADQSNVLPCYRGAKLSNISSRSHHNGNFNKYRVSGRELCLSFVRSSTILGGSVVTNNNNNDEYFPIFHPGYGIAED